MITKRKKKKTFKQNAGNLTGGPSFCIRSGWLRSTLSAMLPLPSAAAGTQEGYTHEKSFNSSEAGIQKQLPPTRNYLPQDKTRPRILWV